MARHPYTGTTQAKAALLDYIQLDLIELFTSLDEVVAARDGESNLLAQIDALQALISTVTTEVTNARDGETNLLTQIDALQALIATNIANIVALGNAELPNQAGNAGKFLTTNATASSWAEILDEDNLSTDSDALPATQQSIKAYVDDHLLDEDNMATDSATLPPSQQSTKAYVDSPVVPQTGGGALSAHMDNEIQDAGTYTIPLANSVIANSWIIISQTDEDEANESTINRTGSDTITDRDGTHTSMVLDQTGSILVKLVSDGTSDWRYK